TSFPRAKKEIFCRMPSSITSKSSFVRSAGISPCASRTVKATFTRFTFTLIAGRSCAMQPAIASAAKVDAAKIRPLTIGSACMSLIDELTPEYHTLDDVLGSLGRLQEIFYDQR